MPEKDIAISFAKEYGYNFIDDVGAWRGFVVFHAIPDILLNQNETDEPLTIGLPVFVLVSNQTARFADYEEIGDIMEAFTP